MWKPITLTIVCFRPCDRNVKDVELICARLRRVDQLCKLPNSVLQQLALCGYYEDLEKAVTRKSIFSFTVEMCALPSNRSFLYIRDELLPSDARLFAGELDRVNCK